MFDMTTLREQQYRFDCRYLGQVSGEGCDEAPPHIQMLELLKKIRDIEAETQALRDELWEGKAAFPWETRKQIKAHVKQWNKLKKQQEKLEWKIPCIVPRWYLGINDKERNVLEHARYPDEPPDTQWGGEVAGSVYGKGSIVTDPQRHKLTADITQTVMTLAKRFFPRQIVRQLDGPLNTAGKMYKDGMKILGPESLRDYCSKVCTLGDLISGGSLILFLYNRLFFNGLVFREAFEVPSLAGHIPPQTT